MRPADLDQGHIGQRVEIDLFGSQIGAGFLRGGKLGNFDPGIGHVLAGGKAVAGPVARDLPRLGKTDRCPGREGGAV